MWFISILIIFLSIMAVIADKKEKKKNEEQKKIQALEKARKEQELEEERRRLSVEREKQREEYRKEQEKRLQALKISNIDNLSGLEFEKYTAWLLSKNGFVDIRVTQGSGDYGADIIATEEKNSVKCCIQCKRLSSKVGIKAVQEAYSAKPYYNCQVAIVITNQYFTKQAIDMANRCKVVLIDRRLIIQMIINANKDKIEGENAV